MRPIKFRAWDKQNKRFIEKIQLAYDGSTDGMDTSEEHPEQECEYFGGYLDNPDYVVEQYTGLKDKNGVEIYEGDIIHWKDEVRAKSDWVGEVVWRDAGFHVDNGGSFSSTEWLETASSIVEVIGNIHENPELLEEDK